MDQTRVSEQGVGSAEGQSLVFPVSLRWVVVCFTFTVGKFHSASPLSPFPSILLFKLSWVWSHSIRL